MAMSFRSEELAENTLDGADFVAGVFGVPGRVWRDGAWRIGWHAALGRENPQVDLMTDVVGGAINTGV